MTVKVHFLNKSSTFERKRERKERVKKGEEDYTSDKNDDGSLSQAKHK